MEAEQRAGSRCAADKGHQLIEALNDYEHRSISIPAFFARILGSQLARREPDAAVFHSIATATLR